MSVLRILGKKFIRRNATKLIKPTFVFFLVASWLLTSWPGIPFTNFPPHVTKTRAAVGDIGIWRDNDGDSIPGTAGTYVKATFETEDRNDGIYTKDGGHDDFDLGETGRYLVMYLLRGSITHNNRGNFKARVTLAGTVIEGSYGTDYARNNANADFFVRGYTFVDASAGDDIAIEWTRDSGSGSPAGSLTATISEVMIVRLPDSTDVAYSHYSDSFDTSGLGGTTWNDVSWNTNEYQTDTAVIEKQAGNTAIRLKSVARYLVIYEISWDNANTRAQRISRATLGGTALQHSYSYTYFRDSSNEYGVVGAMFIVDNTSANQDLVIQAQRGNADSDGSATRAVNESGLFVMEIPSSAETVIAYDGTGGQDVAGSGSNVTINYTRNELQRDSASFTLPSITEVEVEKTADYLFAANVKIGRSGTNNSRLTRAIRWENSGSDLTRGRHGTYLRGNQGSIDTYDGAFNPSMVIALSANDRIEAEVFDSGDDGNSPNDTTQANEVGVSALNLNTLVSTNPTLTQNDWRLYVDNDALDPTDPWPGGATDLAENTSLVAVPPVNDPLDPGDEIRLRMSIAVTDATLSASSEGFILQYKETNDCTDGTSWTDVDAGGGGGTWRFASSSVTDNSTITALRLTVSDVAGRYNKSDPTSTNPNAVNAGQDLEWDWHLEYNGNFEAHTYCFRMRKDDPADLDAYNSDSYPKLDTRPGPSDLMRHGNFFSSFIERGFFWVD